MAHRHEQSELRVILIGGTSHTGKSTLARAIAARLGWDYRTTDTLARHPGRPWSTPTWTVPDHVIEHYSTLSTAELLADVLRHYRDTIWPLVEALVAPCLGDPAATPLVLEGSAVLPDLVVSLPRDRTAALWLTAGKAFLRRRMHAESCYDTRTAAERALIDAFLHRTWLYDERILPTATRLGFPVIDVERAPGTLLDTCLAALGGRFRQDLPDFQD